MWYMVTHAVVLLVWAGSALRGVGEDGGGRRLADVVGALLMSAGSELLVSAAVPAAGPSPSTPAPILFSFGMVGAAMGMGVTTGVSGSACVRV